MICELCNCRTECDYYDRNIKPVLSTEQNNMVGEFANDKYLVSLKKALNSFECEYFADKGAEE